MNERAGLPRIWIITDPEHPGGPIAPIAAALKGCPPGSVGVQLRAPGAPDRQLVAWARELRALTLGSGSLLTVNRRVDVAMIVDADGVHLPERGLVPEDVRVGWPRIPMIGVSRHDRTGLRRAEEEKATFAFLSPVFPVPHKGRPLGINGFAAAIVGVGIPTFALGGIQPTLVRQLLENGACGIAVRRAIYEAHDPRETVRALLRTLDNAALLGD